MFENGKKIKLTDLIDIEFLQEFQDFFAKTMGVASIAVDDNGPITKPSNFTPFCNKYTRGSAEGYRRCNECDIRWGRLAAKNGKPVIYTCHSGLTDFAVPIMIGGEHVASILGGQVLTEPPNEEHFRELARELGIDEDEYIDAVKQIKVVPAATVDAAANFLYLVANAISKIAYKNLELIKNNERERIYRNIIDTIRSSIDIGETKQIIVDIIGNTLGADRCFITEYDKATDKFLVVEDEYLSSDDIPRYKGADPNKSVPAFVEAYKKGKPLLIKNREIFLDTENQNFNLEREAIEKYNVNSAFSFPLFYQDELLGVLATHYVNEEHQITQDEINLITMIGNQVAIAIHQAKLYKMTQENADRESLLRNIIEKIRSSLDIEETLSFICEATAKLFKVQRSAIAKYPCPEKFEEFIIRKEYKSSPELQGFTHNAESIKVAAYFGSILLNSAEVLAFDNIEQSNAPDYFKNVYKSMGVKAVIATSIRKGEEVWGSIVLSEYNNYRHWTEEEKTLLRTISDQIYIAINQSEMYEQEQQQTKREQFGRSIIEILRNTIDKNIVKHLFVRSIAKNFNADRVFFADFDSKNNIYLPVDENSEFLSSSEEKSFVNQNWSIDSMVEYIQPLLEKRELKIACWDEYVKKNVISEDFKSRFEDANVESSYNFPVLYEGTIMGFFCIEFTQERCRKLSDEDISSIRNICTQAGIALYHAELYRKEKETAERERILREVINKIRGSLDIEDIKYEIVNQIGMLFKADRVCIAYYDKNLGTYTVSERGEYRSFDCEKSFIGVRFDAIDGFSEYIRDAHLRGEDIIFSDLESHLDNNNLRGTGVEKFYREFGFISSMALNIVYGDIFLGDLVITFEQGRKFSDDEINFIRTIADQAGTAFYQAGLLEREKLMTENERVLRKIMLSLVQTFNFEEIINMIVTEAGKLFDADRCFFVEYKKEIESYTPIKDYAQYLSSKDIRTHVDIIPGKAQADVFLQLSKQKIIESVDDIYKIDLPEAAKHMLIDELSVKSYLVAPVYYGEIMYGSIVLHYVNKFMHFTQDIIEMSKAIANQAAIVIHQAELFEKEQQTAKRETLLRKITEIIRNSLDINEIKRNVVNEIGKAFNADRCYFRYYDKKNSKFLAPDIEYLLSDKAQSLINEIPDQESLAYFVDELNKRKKGFYPIVVNEEFAKNTPIERYFKSAGIKTDYAMPILDREDELTYLVLHYTGKDPNLSEEDKTLLETIANQVVIALDQAKLYEKEKQTKDMEITLRETIKVIRSTLNIEEIKRCFVEITCNYFNADRCLFDDYNKETKEFLPFQIEILRAEGIKSLVNVNVEGDFPEFAAKLKNKKRNIIIKDLQKTLSRKNLPNYKAVETLHKSDAKSDYGLLVQYKEEIMGILILHYVKQKRVLTHEELDFLKVLRDQVGIALYQAELYEKEKQTAEKETILREILGDIKLTQNIDQSYNYILAKLANIFEVSGVIFIETPDFEYEKPKVKYEYIKNDELPTFQYSEFPDAFSDMFLELVKSQNSLIIDDTKTLYVDNQDAQKFCSEHLIKSFMAIPLVNPTRDVKIPGIFTICSSKLRQWNKNEINLLNVIVSSFTSLIWEIKKLKEVDELINTFILTLSKGVQIPLGVQEKTLEVLASQNENQKIGKFKDIINETLESNKSLFELLTKLLDSYYYESGKKQLSLERCSIAEIINDIKNDLNELAESKSMTININIDKNIPKVEIDKGEIGKIIYSLLENAINYTQNNGIIEIKSYKLGKDIVTCISDNGPGIASEVKERMFQKYAVSQIIEKEVGSGMGLYLSKLVAEAHGGKIWCESEIGVGTIVCFLLPAHQE